MAHAGFLDQRTELELVNRFGLLVARLALGVLGLLRLVDFLLWSHLPT